MNVQSWHKFKQAVQPYLAEPQCDFAIDNLPSTLILVEGATEQILLPYFAQIYGIDLLAPGVIIIPAGGANQIVRKYKYLRKSFNMPIFCIFDRDAQLFAEQILPRMQENDYVHVLADGEIEDILQLDFLIKCLNDYLATDLLNDLSRPITISDFAQANQRTEVLEKIWRRRDLGKFEKVKFAQFIIGESCSAEHLSADGKCMLAKLTELINSQSERPKSIKNK